MNTLNQGKTMYQKMRLAALLGLAFLPGLVSAQEASDRDQQALEAQEQALLQAEQEREAAIAALEDARRELERATEVRERARLDRGAAREAEQAAERAQQEELEAMRRELSRVQEELRRASREVIRAHRELGPAGAPAAPRKAVIGVILGQSDDSGVELLGVSPGGPAEKAGLQPGDKVVSVMGQSLAGAGGKPAGELLVEVMEGVQPGDELDITVLRDEGQTELTLGVVAEAREPIGWTSMIRLPSAPSAPGEPVIIEEIIEVPGIDRQALEEKMNRLKEELEQRRIVISGAGTHEVHVAPEVWDFRFEDLSEMGEDALYGANVWFGMHLTRGLELARVNPELGEYFKADHGVLVLSAGEDNALGLQSGDVVQSVAGKRVDQPADLVRVLREMAPGATLEMDIMRKRRSKTLEVSVPERTLGLGLLRGGHGGLSYRVEVVSD